MVSVFNTTYRSCINCYFYTTEWVGRNGTAVYTISNSEQSPEVEKKEEQELPAPHPDQLKKDKAKAQASPTEIVEERTETEKVLITMMVLLQRGYIRNRFMQRKMES